MLRVWPLSCLLIFILCKYQIRILALDYVEYQHCNTSSLQRERVKNEDALFPYKEHNFLNRTRKEHLLSLVPSACATQLVCTPSQLSQAPVKPRSPTKVPRSSGFWGIRGLPPIALEARSATVCHWGLCNF